MGYAIFWKEIYAQYMKIDRIYAISKGLISISRSIGRKKNIVKELYTFASS
jgi:hypothetical protein